MESCGPDGSAAGEIFTLRVRTIFFPALRAWQKIALARSIEELCRGVARIWRVTHYRAVSFCIYCAAKIPALAGLNRNEKR